MWKDTVSGCCGSVVCIGLGNPFDVAKSRIQVAPDRYTGLINCLGQTVRHEGLWALYRGSVPALTSALAENSVGFTVQRSLRRWLDGDGPPQRYLVSTELALGGITGIFTAMAICPFEVIKVRLQIEGSGGAQVQRSGGAEGVLSELRLLLQQEGLPGLSRGLTAMWARDIPFNALFFGSYETICTKLVGLTGATRFEAEDLHRPSPTAAQPPSPAALTSPLSTVAMTMPAARTSSPNRTLCSREGWRDALGGASSCRSTSPRRGYRREVVGSGS